MLNNAIDAGVAAPPKPPRAIEGRLRKNHDSRIVQVLQGWFRQNAQDPYPSKEERRHLALATGLNESQVVNWFNNARKRRRNTMSHPKYMRTVS